MEYIAYILKKMKEVFISTNSPSGAFKEHISIKNNNRILFSGPFGIGKTVFITNFFSEREPDYFPIFLRPTNYAVASNEDIFKLIKYDILYHLLEKGQIEVEDFGEFTSLEIVQYFLIGAKLEVFIPFISSTGEIGAKASVIMLALDKLREKYLKYKSKINTNQENKKIDSFLKSNNAHYLLENDFITQLIKSSILRINSKKSGGAVLIIDDLDRIDPDHIFRLFNVFSTHFDYLDDSKNKFEFKKIVFVCDVNNIRSIFQSKYGFQTDFNGYIDKFFSTSIFNFNNRSAIIEFINAHTHETELIRLLDRDKAFLIDILTAMLNFNLINLRSLKKILTEKEEKDSIEFINIYQAKNSNFSNFGFTYVAMALNYLMGSSTSLILILEKAIELNVSKKDKLGLFSQPKEKTYFRNYLLPILQFNESGLQLDTTFPFKYNNVSVNYNLEQLSGPRIEAKLLSEYPFHDGLIWTWMRDSVKVLIENNIIN